MVARGGVFIALGSNLGQRQQHIADALRELAAAGDVTVLACSSLHDTEPCGGPPDQPHYLNAVAELATELEPHDLLRRLNEIEARHGRQRTVPNGPRTLDLDLLIYRDQTIATPDLCVPHPRMWQRPFVMLPLAEVCDAARLAAARSLHPTTANLEAGCHVRRSANGTKALA